MCARVSSARRTIASIHGGDAVGNCPPFGVPHRANEIDYRGVRSAGRRIVGMLDGADNEQNDKVTFSSGD